MNRKLTCLFVGNLGLALALAACSSESGASDSASTGGAGSGGGLNVGTGASSGVNDDRIVTRVTPPGFTGDDGTGNPTYVAAGVDDAKVATLSGALGSLPDPDPEMLIDYPFEDTLVPGNLTFIEFQWRRLSGHDTFLIRVIADSKSYHLYLVPECTQSGFCTQVLPKGEWLTLGKELAGQTVDIEIIGTDGSEVARSAPLKLEFSPEPLVGALYYWAAANRVIKRASFGADQAVDFIVPNSPTSDYECVACHSVSRDGTTIALAVGPEEGENISGIQVASTLDPTMKAINPTKGPTPYDASVAHGNTEGPIDSLGHNVALSPDGKLMAVNATDPPTNWPSHLDIRHTNAKDSVVQSYEVGHAIFGADTIGIHPEFSPDGSKLAVTLAENEGSLSAWSNQAGGIGYLPVAADGSLGSAVVVVTAPSDGSYHFYPTWSPDAKYLAFVSSSDANGSSGSLGNDHALLRMVAVADAPADCPGPKCIELTRGTGYTPADALAMSGTTGSTWPKFAPFAQGQNQNVYFITFTSRRKLGVRPLDNTQLWMFGIDTAVTPDPSFSPFWLPYQSPSDGSLSPYWTETLPCNTEGGTCNGCLASEQCVINPDENSCVCEAIPVAK